MSRRIAFYCPENAGKGIAGETADRGAGGIRVTAAGQMCLPCVCHSLTFSDRVIKSLTLTGKRVEQPGTLHPPFRKTRPIVHPRVGDNPRLRA
jgi:hypothetical protein